MAIISLPQTKQSGTSYHRTVRWINLEIKQEHRNKPTVQSPESWIGMPTVACAQLSMTTEWSDCPSELSQVSMLS